MHNKKHAYSVIIVMLLIWFLLVLTVTILNLVLKELRDNRALWNSMKAFAAAETWKELALLKIKDQWYWVDNSIDLNTTESKNILYEANNFNPNRDVAVSYDIGLKPERSNWKYTYSQTLPDQEYVIIPLFYQNNINAIQNTENISVTWNNTIVWNLISWNNWIAGTGNIENSTQWKMKTFQSGELRNSTQTVQNFLSNHNNVYLILFNSWNTSYDFTINSNDLFSKPITHIISSGQIANYKHNIITKYDNTEFLNMLKYAIFSE